MNPLWIVAICAIWSHVVLADQVCHQENSKLACNQLCEELTGVAKGECDENDKCVCFAKNEVRAKRSSRGDLACRQENPDDVCAAFCHWSTGKQEGHCDQDKKCICTGTSERSKRSANRQGDLACRQPNPNEVCAAFCQWTTGKQEGHCDENDKCICTGTSEPLGRSRRSSSSGRGDLACRRENPNDVCAAFCHWTTGKQEGYCDANKKCICTGAETTTRRSSRTTTRRPPVTTRRVKRSVARSDVACRQENPNEVCAAFCQWTTGIQKGHCDENDNCICDARRVTIEKKKKHHEVPISSLACKLENADAVCSAFCQWTAKVEEGYCDAEGNCICGKKPSY